MVKWVPERKCVGDTDIGRELKEKIKDLEKLLNAYYSGAIAEKFTRQRFENEILNKDKMENRSTRKREERFFVNAIVFISYQKSDPLHLPDLGRCKRFHSGSDRHDRHRSGHPDVPHAVSLILPEQR